MSDEQSRGKKQDGNNSQTPHQPAHANQQRPQSSTPAGQTKKPTDRPKDDPSEAPESGDRKAAGND